MKRKFLLALLTISMIIACAIGLSACVAEKPQQQTPSQEAIRYSLNAEGNGYIVYGNGRSNETEIEIAAEYEGLPVVEIGPSAFASNEKITSITIPSTVTTIGDSAFMGTTFKSISLPAGLLTIGKSAFYGAGITSISIPDSVTEVGMMAFQECKNLSEVHLGSGLKNISEGMFSTCTALSEITIPETIESIGRSAFLNSAFTEIVIPDNVTELGESAFSNSTQLVRAEIGDGVTELPERVFSNCYSLEKVILSDNITSLGDWAFFSCYNLSELVLPTQFKNADGDPFCNCWTLTIYCVASEKPSTLSENWAGVCDVVWNCENNNISEDGKIYYKTENGLRFSVYASNKTAEYERQKTTLSGDIVVPSKVQLDGDTYVISSICHYMFQNCGEITSITIEEGITTVGQAAFGACGELTKIDFPASIQSVSSGAFSDTTNVDYDEPIPLLKDESNWYEGGFYIDNVLFDIKPDVTVLNIKEGTRAIADQLFYGTNISELTVPDSIEYLNTGVFAGLQTLEKLTIPFVGEERGERGNLQRFFHDNVPSTLKEVTVTDETVIYQYTYANCSSIEKLSYTRPLERIEERSLSDCTSLKTFGYGGDLESWCDFEYADRLTFLTVLIDGEELEGELVLPSDLTEIKEFTFRGFDKITSVTVPESVRTIGMNAFNGCSTLKNIVLPDNLQEIGYYAFAGTAIENIVLPKTLTEIGAYAFMDCTSLTGVYISGDTSAVVVDDLFENVNADCTLYVEGSVAQWLNDSALYTIATNNINVKFGSGDQYASVSSTFEVPGSVTALHLDRLAVLGDIVELIIPDTVTEIYGDFYNFKSLTKIDLESEDWPNNFYPQGSLPDNVAVNFAYNLTLITTDEIFDYKLKQDKKEAILTAYKGSGTTVIVPSVIDGNKVVGIGAEVFAGNTSITAVAICDGITTIADGAFANCTSLETVYIPSSVTDMGSKVFENNPALSDDGGTGIGIATGATNTQVNSWPLDWKNYRDYPVTTNAAFSEEHLMLYSISSGAAGIAFYFGKESDVTVPAALDGYTVTQIGTAFTGNTNLVSITLPEGVEIIGPLAFSGCANLTTVVLPDTLESISWQAFSNCTSLKEITLPDSVTIIGASVFKGCINLASVKFAFKGQWIMYMQDEYGQPIQSTAKPINSPVSADVLAQWVTKDYVEYGFISTSYLGS